MITLIVVGFLAGVITSISPCVLPVLPVVLTAGTSRRTPATVAGTAAVADDEESDRSAEEPKRWSWRPYGVVAGLVLSFCVSTLFGSLLLSALHLPQDLLRDAGIVVLVLIGVSLIWTWFGELLERPFARIRGRQVNPDSNGLVTGLGLGLLFVPCAGPVLATIAVVGATHKVGFGAVVLTAAFGIGVGVPLLVLAVAGDAIARRTGLLRRRARAIRVTAGVLMIVVAVAIGFNVTDALQRDVPGYTTALQNSVEQNPSASSQLRALETGNGADNNTVQPGDTCTEGGQTLENCGPAPELTGITGWLNTPGGTPLTLASLRGKVVLIDFWTYSCINCQRTLPHVEAWYKAYQSKGLVVIGVHTPEFAFEHVESNVREQAAALGVKYPIAIDDNYATWNAYANQYWPAEYLIDQTGQIRHVTFGEGDYGTTEDQIRQLLGEGTPGVHLPPATDVADATPTEQQTQETYLGSQYAPLHVSGTAPTANSTRTYQPPAAPQPDTFALSGTWTESAEMLTAGPDAKLELNYQANEVYLVIGGTGSVSVAINGKTTRTFMVSGVPKLYTLASGQNDVRSTLTLTAGQGIQAYDFTFG
ncbi:MAG TPA: cytochrome c biogenesis protein DipZ [Pseudonocardiaceae bacterium]|jgi:cytochrome c biogenesis protein CcdA/thiol-disulfide isomerase/thioredoxin|nr:cytochrome c biogenesis protein DipZ [Pseudonocardiaceae bacterium]